jgi:hypothetical protein
MSEEHTIRAAAYAIKSIAQAALVHQDCFNQRFKKTGSSFRPSLNQAICGSLLFVIGCPKTLLNQRREITQRPCGHETQGGRGERGG